MRVSVRVAEKILSVSFGFFVASLGALVSVFVCLAFDAPLFQFAWTAIAFVVLFLLADVLKFVGLCFKRRAEDEKHFRNLSDHSDRDDS